MLNLLVPVRSVASQRAQNPLHAARILGVSRVLGAVMLKDRMRQHNEAGRGVRRDGRTELSSDCANRHGRTKTRVMDENEKDANKKRGIGHTDSKK